MYVRNGANVPLTAMAEVRKWGNYPPLLSFDIIARMLRFASTKRPVATGKNRPIGAIRASCSI